MNSHNLKTRSESLSWLRLCLVCWPGLLGMRMEQIQPHQIRPTCCSWGRSFQWGVYDPSEMSPGNHREKRMSTRDVADETASNHQGKISFFSALFICFFASQYLLYDENNETKVVQDICIYAVNPSFLSSL